MLHKMKLQENPFERIKNGTKTVEFRLYDEKRQSIQIGDEIEFSKLPELQEKLLVKVIDLYKEESFEKLFKKVFVGEDKEKIIEKAKSMNRFYTPEQEKEYGVVGIKIEIIKKEAHSRKGYFSSLNSDTKKRGTTAYLPSRYRQTPCHK